MTHNIKGSKFHPPIVIHRQKMIRQRDYENYIKKIKRKLEPIDLSKSD